MNQHLEKMLNAVDRGYVLVVNTQTREERWWVSQWASQRGLKHCYLDTERFGGEQAAYCGRCLRVWQWSDCESHISGWVDEFRRQCKCGGRTRVDVHTCPTYNAVLISTFHVQARRLGTKEKGDQRKRTPENPKVLPIGWQMPVRRTRLAFLEDLTNEGVYLVKSESEEQL